MLRSFDMTDSIARHSFYLLTSSLWVLYTKTVKHLSSPSSLTNTLYLHTYQHTGIKANKHHRRHALADVKHTDLKYTPSAKEALAEMALQYQQQPQAQNNNNNDNDNDNDNINNNNISSTNLSIGGQDNHIPGITM